jgi:hypothetical protein
MWSACPRGSPFLAPCLACLCLLLTGGGGALCRSDVPGAGHQAAADGGH